MDVLPFYLTVYTALAVDVLGVVTLTSSECPTLMVAFPNRFPLLQCICNRDCFYVQHGWIPERALPNQSWQYTLPYKPNTLRLEEPRLSNSYNWPLNFVPSHRHTRKTWSFRSD